MKGAMSLLAALVLGKFIFFFFVAIIFLFEKRKTKKRNEMNGK